MQSAPSTATHPPLPHTAPTPPPQVCCVGESTPHKLSLKWGCLDFVHTLLTSPRLSVHPVIVNLDLCLLTECGVFLEGVSHDCHMTVAVGNDTEVPENAVIRLDLGSAGISSAHPMTFTLPSLSTGQSHDCHMTLSVDANMSHDNLSTDKLITWTHQV